MAQQLFTDVDSTSFVLQFLVLHVFVFVLTHVFAILSFLSLQWLSCISQSCIIAWQSIPSDAKTHRRYLLGGCRVDGWFDFLYVSVARLTVKYPISGWLSWVWRVKNDRTIVNHAIYGLHEFTKQCLCFKSLKFSCACQIWIIRAGVKLQSEPLEDHQNETWSTGKSSKASNSIQQERLQEH